MEHEADVKNLSYAAVMYTMMGCLPGTLKAKGLVKEIGVSPTES